MKSPSQVCSWCCVPKIIKLKSASVTRAIQKIKVACFFETRSRYSFVNVLNCVCGDRLTGMGSYPNTGRDSSDSGTDSGICVTDR